MNGYNFTGRVRRVLQLAREEAARLHHEHVGTEHILLGLIREGEGVGAAVLTNLNVDLEEIKQRIEETVKPGKTAAAAGPDLPYTSRAKKVLEFAMSEARELNDKYVGTEHLLLGVLREEKGIGAQVLTDAGVTLETARSEVLRALGTQRSEASSATPPATPPVPYTPAARGSLQLALQEARDPSPARSHRSRGAPRFHVPLRGAWGRRCRAGAGRGEPSRSGRSAGSAGGGRRSRDSPIPPAGCAR